MNNEANSQFHTLRLVLGDQLDSRHRWFEKTDPGVLFVIAELAQEATYVRHHVQKVCAFFAAMEQFAIEMDSRGHKVLHLKLDESLKHENLAGLIQSICDQHGITGFEFQSPDEYRLRMQLRQLQLGDARARCNTVADRWARCVVAAELGQDGVARVSVHAASPGGWELSDLVLARVGASLNLLG